MFSDTYRKLNDSAHPSPALVEATLARTRRPARRRLRRPAAAAAVLALFLCAAAPAAAATVEPVYQALYLVSPAAAQFFQPVRRSCTANGVTMEVEAVQVEGSAARAYITLSGDAVDETCDLFDSWRFRLPFDQTGHCERVGYDAASRTATFLCTTETLSGKPIPTGGKMTFSVDCFLSGKEAAENLAVDLALGDYAAEAETVPAGAPGDAYACTGGSGDVPMLRPGSSIAAPSAGLSITAMGYADGLFHVQVCRGNATQLDNHCRLWLEDGAGNQVEPLSHAGFTTDWDTSSRLDYDEFVFGISPEDLDSCTLRGDFYTAASRTDGGWRVTFPLENT